MKQALGDRLVGFELMSGVALGLSRAHHPELPDPLPGHPWYVLLQADDSAAAAPLAAEVEAALARRDRGRRRRRRDASRSRGSRPARLWALRENISEAQRREGPNIKHDIALPVSAIPAFIEATGHRR